MTTVLRRLRRVGDPGFTTGTTLFAAAILILLAAILYLLARDAHQAWSALGIGFLWGRDWNPASGVFGALPYVFGTLASSLLALALAVPVAVGTAVALVELLPRWLSRIVGLFVELLAAVPSIIFGIWGLAVVVPFVRDLGGEGTFGFSLLSAGIVLAIMILPIITAVSRDMLRAVPPHQREAALALGCTDWEVTWKVILPNARSGIFAAAILGLGRAIGETMAVILVIGAQATISWNVFDPAYTISALIANTFGEVAPGELARSALIELGLLLLLITLALNVVARIVVQRLSRGRSTA